MLFKEKAFLLKDGREAAFKSPTAVDAVPMRNYLFTCAGETDFILRYPEECNIPDETEAAFLQRVADSPDAVMIACTIDGEIAGNCEISFNTRMKTAHRASVAIAIVKKYWGLGIGTAMFREMIALAEERKVRQIELDYIEGNERARALYEKMGFESTGERPDAIRLRDGTFLKEISMRKLLS